MKKLILLCAALASLFAISLLIGCGLQKSNVTYVVRASGFATVMQTVSYEVAAVNNAVAGSYVITPHGVAPSLTLTASNFYSTDQNFVTPYITLNRVHIDYSVVTDSQSILAGWTPTAVDTATNSFIIPRGSSSSGASGEASASGEAGSSTTALLNNLTNFNHLSEVANKILTVNQTVSGGVYSYTLSLKTILVVRANVTLSGQDEYGNPVSTGFITDIQYTI